MRLLLDTHIALWAVTDGVAYFREAGFDLIPISAAHTALVSALPPIHNDPFDRLLVVQANAVSATLVTHDKLIAKYGDWVVQV